jgi:hypothetical protein
LKRIATQRNGVKRPAAAWDEAKQKQHNVAFQIPMKLDFSPINTLLESQYPVTVARYCHSNVEPQ